MLQLTHEPNAALPDPLPSPGDVSAHGQRDAGEHCATTAQLPLLGVGGWDKKGPKRRKPPQNEGAPGFEPGTS